MEGRRGNNCLMNMDFLLEVMRNVLELDGERCSQDHQLVSNYSLLFAEVRTPRPGISNSDAFTGPTYGDTCLRSAGEKAAGHGGD